MTNGRFIEERNDRFHVEETVASRFKSEDSAILLSAEIRATDGNLPDTVVTIRVQGQPSFQMMLLDLELLAEVASGFVSRVIEKEDDMMMLMGTRGRQLEAHRLTNTRANAAVVSPEQENQAK